MRKTEGLSGCRDACGEPRKNAAGRIFETARDLFYMRGIRAVGVDEIVSQAGVTKPSLYRSFESKDELVAVCLESFADEAKAELSAKVEQAGDDGLAQMRALIAHYVERLKQPDFRGCPMTNTAVEFPDSGIPGRAVIETCKMEFRELVVGIARRMPADAPEELADGIVLLVEGAFGAHHVFGSQGPSSALEAAAERLIAAHLKDGKAAKRKRAHAG